MRRDIVIRPAALRDVEQIASYIGKRSSQSAVRLVDAFESTLQTLLDQPGMGRPRASANPAAAGLRSWRIRGFKRYLIFYRKIENGLEVFRVLHGARDIGRILNSEL